MKAKFICKSSAELNYLVGKYPSFFYDINLMDAIKRKMECNCIIYFYYENGGISSWCYETDGCKISCEYFENCKSYKNIDVKRILKLDRICKTK